MCVSLSNSDPAKLRVCQASCIPDLMPSTVLGKQNSHPHSEERGKQQLYQPSITQSVSGEKVDLHLSGTQKLTRSSRALIIVGILS